MLLSNEQIQQLLLTIERNTNVFIVKNIGADYLTDQEKNQLLNIGINPNTVYNPSQDKVMQSFYFGLISDSLKDDGKKTSFESLKKHFESGEHIPLTKIEKYALESVKKQFLGDIRANKNRIFQDVNNIIADKEKSNRSAYEQVIRNEIERGVVDKKVVNEISRELARKTGDWSRDFSKIVEYISHYSFNEGRLASYERNGDDKVYFDVFPGACKHCIRLYLTNGEGSKPRIFNIKELKANGTNIGKKVGDWKATLSPIHPFCFSNPFVKIYTSKGWKNIKDIKVGDEVLTHKKRFRKVTDLIISEKNTNDVKGLYSIGVKIKYKGKDKILYLKGITGNHPVFVNNKWKDVSDLTLNDKLIFLQGKCKGSDNIIPLNNNLAEFFSQSVRSIYNTTKQWQNEEIRENMCDSISKGSYKRWETEDLELRRSWTSKAREVSLKMFENGTHPFLSEEVRSKANKALGEKRTYIEKLLASHLECFNVKYEIYFPIKRKELKSNGQPRYYYPDIYIPKLNIVLEADGEKWHKGREKEDIEKDREIKKLIGADVFRFTSYELLKTPGEAFLRLEKILNNHNGKYSFFECEIVSIKRVKAQDNKIVKLYNFSVDEDESYVANSIVVHNCRCTVNRYITGQEWSEDNKEFTSPSIETKKFNRPKVRFVINSKEYFV